MSKKQYIETFSTLNPSEESIERIMSMTDKKRISRLNKTLIIIAVVISLLCSVGLVANAATGGAVAESVSEVVEKVSKKMTVLVNGKEEKVTVSEKIDPKDEKYYPADEKCYAAVIEVKSPDTDTKYEVLYEDAAGSEDKKYYPADEKNYAAKLESKTSDTDKESEARYEETADSDDAKNYTTEAVYNAQDIDKDMESSLDVALKGSTTKTE